MMFFAVLLVALVQANAQQTTTTTTTYYTYSQPQTTTTYYEYEPKQTTTTYYEYSEPSQTQTTSFPSFFSSSSSAPQKEFSWSSFDFPGALQNEAFKKAVKVPFKKLDGPITPEKLSEAVAELSAMQTALVDLEKQMADEMGEMHGRMGDWKAKSDMVYRDVLDRLEFARQSGDADILYALQAEIEKHGGDFELVKLLNEKNIQSLKSKDVTQVLESAALFGGLNKMTQNLGLFGNSPAPQAQPAAAHSQQYSGQSSTQGHPGSSANSKTGNFASSWYY